MHRHIHWQNGHVLPGATASRAGRRTFETIRKVAKLSIKPIRRFRTTRPDATAAHLERGGR